MTFKEEVITDKNNHLKNLSQEGKDFLKLLLETDPKKRPNTSELLQNNWITNKSNNNNDEENNSFLINEEGILKSNAFKTAIKNAKDFNIKNKIKELLLSYIIRHLAKIENLHYLIKCFQLLDKDNDGLISKNELIEGIKNIVTPEQANDEVNIILKNLKINNGFINYDDFIKACIDKDNIITDKNLTILFKLMDKDNNGKISKEDFRNFLNSINYNNNDFNNYLDNNNKNDIYNDFIKQLNLKGDGMICLKEFKKIMKSNVVN